MPHYHGHRKRLRERFRKTGFDGFRNYEALELLLAYAIPRRDVKPLAKALIKKFGGLRGVMDATYEELVSIKGISEYSATFINALKGCSALYLKEGIRGKKTRLSSTTALLDYCRVAMSGLKDEQFRAVFLNSQNQVISDEVIQEGTVNQSVVYPRKVMERALLHKATALILVHNHPGGSCRPSEEDTVLTAELVRVAGGLDIRVHDHIIICKSGYFSFLEKGLM
jgi:DNA repair protein RadC